jgi:hypothetical protein
VTAYAESSKPADWPPPMVGLVSNVTNDYFVINTCVPASVPSGPGFIRFLGFFWVAIGCGVGCGQGKPITQQG